MVEAPSWDPRRLAGWESGRLSAEGRLPIDRWRRLMDRCRSIAAPAAATAIDVDPDAESCALQNFIIWSPLAQAGFGGTSACCVDEGSLGSCSHPRQQCSLPKKPKMNSSPVVMLASRHLANIPSVPSIFSLAFLGLGS